MELIITLHTIWGLIILTVAHDSLNAQDGAASGLPNHYAYQKLVVFIHKAACVNCTYHYNYLIN